MSFAVSTAARPRVRSVLICHRGALLDREGLSAWMASFSDLAGIVELDETSDRTVQRIKAQVRRSGVWRLLDVFALRLYYRIAHARRDRQFERDTVAALAARFGPPPAVPVLQASSVNAQETIDFLEGCRPDFVIARCKTILKPAVFQVPTSGTYVLHPGICPEYRNAHGCFWALSAGDLERVGLTLLRIDAGVDTGPIYGYFTYPFDERGETHVRIQQRVLTENLDAIRDRLLDAVAGRAERMDTAGRTSAVWGQPWLTAFLRWKWAARRRPGGANARVALS
jgi:folate-dependent phosphoribosylglycinamide formyltransferase PurN